MGFNPLNFGESIRKRSTKRLIFNSNYSQCSSLSQVWSSLSFQFPENSFQTVLKDSQWITTKVPSPRTRFLRPNTNQITLMGLFVRRGKINIPPGIRLSAWTIPTEPWNSDDTPHLFPNKQPKCYHLHRCRILPHWVHWDIHASARLEPGESECNLSSNISNLSWGRPPCTPRCTRVMPARVGCHSSGKRWCLPIQEGKISPVIVPLFRFRGVHNFPQKLHRFDGFMKNEQLSRNALRGWFGCSVHSHPQKGE